MEKVAEPGRMRPFSFACLGASRPGFTCEFADGAISRHHHRTSVSPGALVAIALDRPRSPFLGRRSFFPIPFGFSVVYQDDIRKRANQALRRCKTLMSGHSRQTLFRPQG